MTSACHAVECGELANFEIIEKIGHGQFSTVYKARWHIESPIATAAAATAAVYDTNHIAFEPTAQLNYHRDQNYTPPLQPHIGAQGSPLQLQQPVYNDQLTDRHQLCPQNHSYQQDLLSYMGGCDSNNNNNRQSLVDSVGNIVDTNLIHSETTKLVALKRIKFYDIHNSKARMDYLKEVNLLKQVKHPNIINFHEAFIERNELFIVLELADGGDLSKLIRYFQRKKRLIPEQTILKYFTQVCSAIEYIHSKRILHRDIKPANIFMTSDGCVKLGDFGLGRFFSQNTRDAHSIVGTFYYMSPERISESGYEFSSDVWSIGCVLYELITLHSPFSIMNHEQDGTVNSNNVYNLQWLIDRIVRAEYPSLDGYAHIRPIIRQLATECLNPDPNRRPNMQAICALIHRV